MKICHAVNVIEARFRYLLLHDAISSKIVVCVSVLVLYCPLPKLVATRPHPPTYWQTGHSSRI
ncbi:MAG: hypothetical protein ACI814_000852 [Mariniblastus sp.]|jgi:hypothetical protein